MSAGREPTAREFLELLRQRDLLPEDVLQRWEQEISRAKKPLGARWLADRLIELDYLTTTLADRLLQEAARRSQPAEKRPSSPIPTAPGKERPRATDDLDLLPVDVPQPPPKQPAVKPPAPAPRKPSPAEPVPRTDEDLWAEVESAVSPLEETLPAEAPVLVPVRRRKNVWESPLFLIGGGALILLIIVMVALLWAVRRQGADQLFALAEQDYQSGSYTQAIAKFTEFLEKFPRHPRAGIARVHRGLARLRQAVDGGGDWVENLRIAQEVLTEISGEETFKDEARGELIALLPRIAHELARRALDQLSAELVDRAEEALALVNRYIAPSDRPGPLISEIEATLAITRHWLAAGGRLSETLEEIEKALSTHDVDRAHELRRQLIRDYPQLAADPKLAKISGQITAVERELVRVGPAEAEVRQTDWPKVAEHILLACRSTEQTATALPGGTVCALHQGVAFGLAATTGEVLWRRVVGEHITPAQVPAVPLPIQAGNQTDFLLVDALHRELLRLDARSGRLRWRVQLAEAPAAQPLIAHGRIWLVFASGKLLELTADDGLPRREIRFPQRLRVTPAVDDRGQFLFQPAEHSSVYVIRLADGSCVQSYFLGHESGSLVLPPVTMGSYVLVTVFSGVKQSDVHIFRIRREEEEPLQPAQLLRLPARVAFPPLVSGSRVLVASQEGPAWVYEVIVGETERPFREIAQGNLGPAERERGPSHKVVFARFGHFESAQVWIADAQLTCYDLLAPKAALQPRAIRNEASVSVQPLVAIDGMLCHIRKVWGLPDLVVSAFRVNDAQLLWETRLGVPLASEPVLSPDGQLLICVTQGGSVFRLPVDRLHELTIVDEPYITLKLAELQGPLQTAIALPGGEVVLILAEGSPRLPVYDPAEPMPRFRWLLLKSPVAGQAGAFGPGVVLGTQSGQILWIHPRHGTPLAEPFAFPRPTEAPPRFVSPVAVNEQELLIGEISGWIGRLRLAVEPRAHFRLENDAQWRAPLVTPLAMCGRVVYAGDKQGNLVGFSLPELKPTVQIELGELPVWGPHSAGDCVLVATTSELLCVDESGKTRWRNRVEHDVPVGKPYVQGGVATLASADGWLVEIDLRSGTVVTSSQLEAPLATGPVLVDNRWVVGGRDGCLYLVPRQ